jgi:hypothetical protein
MVPVTLSTLIKHAVLLLLLLLCGAGQLSTLLDYIAALLVVPGHTAEAAAAIETVCKIVAAVGDRYRQQHDLLSLVLLFESTQVSSWLVGGVLCHRAAGAAVSPHAVLWVLL